MQQLELKHGRQTWRADLTQPYDLSIPLDFDKPQPSCFRAPRARSETYSVGSFEGDVRLSGSCNCTVHTFIPHCNGTHTECVGHLTYERVSVRDVVVESLLTAKVISVQPTTSSKTRGVTDMVITAEALQRACEGQLDTQALVVRSLPNGPEKLSRNYDEGPCPAYFEVEAMQWLVDRDVEHLLVDLPSVDRIADEGRLSAHRIFWGLPEGASSVTQAARSQATITELAYVSPRVADGLYLLNLQIAPFVADASPSRPVLYPLVRA